jgi:hypothetical protein
MRANRAFLGRVVRYLAGEADMRQFLDIGTGIPTAGNTHQVTQAVAPETRVAYVDNDRVKSCVGHMAGDESRRAEERVLRAVPVFDDPRTGAGTRPLFVSGALRLGQAFQLNPPFFSLVLLVIPVSGLDCAGAGGVTRGGGACRGGYHHDGRTTCRRQRKNGKNPLKVHKFLQGCSGWLLARLCQKGHVKPLSY